MSDGGQQVNQSGEMDLLSIQINIGDALQLQDVSTNKQRHYVKLIGYLNNKSVLVTHPAKDGELLPVSEGQNFLVRGFAERKTYDFKTRVTGIGMSPFPYLHLSFPAQINVVTMRGALRIRPNLGCLVLSQIEALKLPATIEDISTSGAKISTRKDLGDVGDDVIVNFRLAIDGEELVYNVVSVIRNKNSDIEKSSGERIVMYGVQFMQPEGKERTALQNFICKFMVEGQ